MKSIIKRDGKTVGFIKYRYVGEPKKHMLLEITRIEVDREYRRHGVATELFQRMLRHTYFRKLFVTTHFSNATACKFYEKMGMNEEATLVDHYYKEEDEIVYSMFRRIENDKP